jgi:hypothetical protein
MPSGFTTVPLPVAVISATANGGRRRATNGAGARLSLPGIDWRRWLGLRWLRRAVTARPRWRGRLGSNCGEHRRNTEQQAAVWALLCSREGVGQLGWRREKVEARAHRGGGNGRGEKGSRLNRWASAWNQPFANTYIWLQYGCFCCIWNQLHRSEVVDKWLQLERCSSLRQP